ncbi:Putative DD34D transposase [Caligus rogercresseyi]|uniref:DD34D transposase n=1 Tax=Caligus rogercresseyi TaxID=217165 RepID=A0A7T8KF00_CALRO|nr:Putative DD34D transposase [Caligus rogercresseyi]
MDHIRQYQVKTSQTVVKPGLTASKVLLFVWWDWKRIIHYEQWITANNCTVLTQAIDQKCPELANRKGVVFQQDNV